MIVNGTDVTFTGQVELTEGEIQAYIEYLQKQHPGRRIKSLTIGFDGDNADLDYTVEEPKFERIRRITGYLVGSIDRWNNAKRAEEHDRVKHKIEL